MKILFASFTYYPADNGVANVTKYLAEGLARKKHKVFVVTQNQNVKDANDNKLEQNGVEICFLSANVESELKREYYSKILDVKPDVFICVCTQTWTFDWLYDADWNKLFGNSCKTILYTHGFSGLDDYSGDQNKGLIRKLKEIKFRIKWDKYYKKHIKTMKKFDVVTHLSASNESYEYAINNGIENNVVIGNAVEDMFFDNPSCERNTSSDLESATNVVRFIYVANYHTVKNQKALLRSYYHTISDNTELIMIGGYKSTYYDELCKMDNELSEQFGKRNVKILAGISRDKISEWLSESDVFVVPSLWEAYSISLLEALAKGLPVISTNVGNAHLIPGVIITESENEMTYMMDWLCDRPQLRQSIGRLNRKYAESNARIEDKVDYLEHICIS